MIYKTENTETGEIFATKFEKREGNGGMSLLVREIKVLIEVQEFEGIPNHVIQGFLKLYFMEEMNIITISCKPIWVTIWSSY